MAAQGTKCCNFDKIFLQIRDPLKEKSKRINQTFYLR